MDATPAPPLAYARPVKRKPPGLLSIFMDLGVRIPLVALAMAAILSVLWFPYSSDAPLTAAEQADLWKFYSTAYEKPSTAVENEDAEYVKIAQGEADKKDVTGNMVDFARTFGLTEKK